MKDFGRWARSDAEWRGPRSEEVQRGTGCVRRRRFAVRMGGMREVLLTSRLETRCSSSVVACCSMHSHVHFVYLCEHKEKSSASCELLKQIRWFYDQR